MLFTALLGCGGDDGSTVDSSDGELDVPRRKAPPYVAAPVRAAGMITGTVTVTAAPSQAAAAPVAPPSATASACAAAPAGDDADVVVFLEDITRGRPVPADAPRRYELAAEPCALTPRVLVAVAGGTLNLSNAVPTVHHVSFTFEGMKNPLLRVPFSDRGQIVPTEKVLAVPGVVTVTSDQGPGAQAQIVVVEHPYAVALTQGRFTLDSVPPGNYSLVAVGAGGRATTTVAVQSGATTTVALQLPPR